VGAGVGVGIAVGDGGAAVTVEATVVVARGEARISVGSPPPFWQARRARAAAKAARADDALKLDISRRFYRKNSLRCTQYRVSRHVRDHGPPMVSLSNREPPLILSLSKDERPEAAWRSMSDLT
jgi:hypothetical protein